VAGGWRFYRHREDKLEANYITVAMSTLRSLESSVPKERLLEMCQEIKSFNEIEVGNKRKRSDDGPDGMQTQR
jgi:hypothetical protein